MKPQYIYAKETLVLRISKTSIERQNRKEKTMILSVYIIMSFGFPFVRLFGVR
jgi:hypothetical protein